MEGCKRQRQRQGEARRMSIMQFAGDGGESEAPDAIAIAMTANPAASCCGQAQGRHS